MSKVEEFIAESKLSDLLKRNEDEKQKNTVIWVLAIIGAVAAVAGIAYAVYRFFTPDYLEDFEDDFDDDFDDYFSEEDQVQHISSRIIKAQNTGGMHNAPCLFYCENRKIF